MPKVELSKIRLAVTAIEQRVVVTIPSKDGFTMLHKHDVSSDFLKCIIDFGANKKWDIVRTPLNAEKPAETYEVACIDKKGYKKAIYPRKDVAKLLVGAINAGVSKENIDEWIANKLV